MESNKEQENEIKKEQKDKEMSNNEKENKQQEDNKINEIRLNNIGNKFNYFQNTKDNYDKLFFHEFVENIHLIENSQELIDKKLNYLKLNKDYYNIKKPELDMKLQLKKQTKNLFIEELSNNNKKDNADSYFSLSPQAFNLNNGNANSLYKSDGLLNIF